MRYEELLPGLWRFEDTCNVYVVKKGDRAIAIDFGSGEWMKSLTDLGVAKLDHVFLTHHHADQCHGLDRSDDWPFVIHAPSGEQRFLEPTKLKNPVKYDRKGKGCPASYSVPRDGLDNVRYDISGFMHLMWETERIRFLSTPGHGPNACSVIVDIDGKQVVFCGDAAYEDAAIWRPFNLEWDHWTGAGALAAWEGVVRLRDIHVDLLCPSHGEIVKSGARELLSRLADKLLAFYQVKNSISPDEPDLFIEPESILSCDARKYSESLYQFGNNSYLLLSNSGETLIVDPYFDMKEFDQFLKELNVPPPSAALVSHYHLDHCGEMLIEMRERFKTRVVLHESIAEPVANVETAVLPWLPSMNIEADEIWKGAGKWTWNEYEFDFCHWPGQTWGHCLFGTVVDGRRVAFAGDSFQANSQWNGTGGFCAYNNSRFIDGFADSAQKLIAWKPEIVAAGHKAVYCFQTSKFEKIVEWAEKAERVIKELCPNHDLDKDYYVVSTLYSESASVEGSMFWG